MFPPESSGEHRARRRSTRPASSAATPTAPAPSTTSFVRSRSSTIASEISSSLTSTIVLERALEDRPCQLARVLDRDPVGDRLLARRADADQPRARPHRLQRERDARGEPTAADGNEHGARLGDLLGELEADRALAGDHELVLERVDERRAASSSTCRRAAATASSKLAPTISTVAP